MSFWDEIRAQLERVGSEGSTAAAVIGILNSPEYPEVRAESAAAYTPSATRGFFAGSGGDDTLRDALRTAGWRVTWSEASYYYRATAPNGDVLEYCEGDVTDITPARPVMVDGEFPGVRVRFAQPTNYSGARYVATARRGDHSSRAVTGFDFGASSQRENVAGVAWAARVKLCARLDIEPGERGDYVAVVTDYTSTDYVVTFVPRWALANLAGGQ